MRKEPAEHPIGNEAEPSGSWLAEQGVEAERGAANQKDREKSVGLVVEVCGELSPHNIALRLGTLKFDCIVKAGLKTRAEG